jgi:NAD(P)-dependent dehydrogenase (short-subunit alcohol dehydrogenase family)
VTSSHPPTTSSGSTAVGAEYVEADAANYTAVENLVNSAVSSFGRFAVMVNNAGIFTACHTIADQTGSIKDPVNGGPGAPVRSRAARPSAPEDRTGV